MAKIKIAPRREAQYFGWSQLDQSQKDAYVKAFSLLGQYTKNVQSLNASNSLIQRQRQSQIIFIDGERGTGKTSILTTLIHSTENKTHWDEFFDKKDLQNPEVTELQTLFLSQKMNSIVWLDILDLEMLPEPTNLLASLCVRIEEKFNSLGNVFYSSQLVEKSERDAWRNFSDLMHDFALGWKTNLSGRMEVDPDTYSSEVLRVEKARLQLDQFPEKLLNLGKFYRHSKNLTNEPLFVLPVDDADLNPQRFLDLLDLTRRAKAQNLVFLVLGNYNNLAQLLEWRYASEISTILPSKEIEQMAGKYVNQMEEFATHWAYSALQKLIPQGAQLIHLSTFSAEEALKHVASGCEFDGENISLSDLLKIIKTPNVSGQIKDYLKPHTNFFDFMTLKKWKKDEAEDGQDKNIFETQILSLFEGPIRSIENLSRVLVELINKLIEFSEHQPVRDNFNIRFEGKSSNNKNYSDLRANGVS